LAIRTEALSKRPMALSRSCSTGRLVHALEEALGGAGDVGDAGCATGSAG
jgi:hypothetical protein